MRRLDAHLTPFYGGVLSVSEHFGVRGASWTQSPVGAKGRLQFSCVMKHYFSFDFFPSLRNGKAILCMQAIENQAAAVRQHLTPTRRATMKKPESVGEDVEKPDPGDCWQECEMARPLWRTVWRVLKT